MPVTSNPAPLYPAIGWVGNLLLFGFNLCVLPRAPPGLRKFRSNGKSFLVPKLKRPPGGIPHQTD